MCGGDVATIGSWLEGVQQHFVINMWGGGDLSCAWEMWSL